MMTLLLGDLVVLILLLIIVFGVKKIIEFGENE